MNETKKCGRCGKVRPASEYKLSERTADGLGSRCQECRDKRTRYGDGTAEDAYCYVCGVFVPEETVRAQNKDRMPDRIYCHECLDKVHRWKLNTWMLCVRDPGEGGHFRGGHFQVREVREMLYDGSLDVGAEFEVYEHGQYAYRVRVVGAQLHNQVCEGVESSEYVARGDRRVLIGGVMGKRNATSVWFQRGLERTKGHADFEWILGVAVPAAEKRLGRAVATIVVPPGEADKVPEDCGLLVVEDPAQLPGTFGLGGGQ